mmetsp:Transcript_44900/g.81944  ORF Transcript_44900/g.81944 Transcript_44900/m.81944 type:complete len:474 (-) Transcript_44900:65-1486(-)
MTWFAKLKSAFTGKKPQEHVIPVVFNPMSDKAELRKDKTGFPALISSTLKPDGSQWMSGVEWHTVITTLEECLASPRTEPSRRLLRRYRCWFFAAVGSLVPCFAAGFGMSFGGCVSSVWPVCIIGLVFAAGFVPCIGVLIYSQMRGQATVQQYAAIVLSELPDTFRTITRRYPFLDLDLRDAHSGPGPRCSIVFRIVQPKAEVVEEPKGTIQGPAIVGRPVAQFEPLPVAVPSYWQTKPSRDHFLERCQVAAEAQQCLESALRSTFKARKTRDRGGEMPSGLKLVNCHRVENSRLWALYEKRKSQLKSKRPQGCTSVTDHMGAVSTTSALGPLSSDLDATVNEFYLWHGTSPAGATGVSAEGFRMEMSGSTTGSMFGPGAYFAECSSKADEYSQGGDGVYAGMFALLLCRVVCGEMLRQTRPNKSEIDSALQSGIADAVLGDREASVGTYREFVVFNSACIYPEYVLLYVREK